MQRTEIKYSDNRSQALFTSVVLPVVTTISVIVAMNRYHDEQQYYTGGFIAAFFVCLNIVFAHRTSLISVLQAKQKIELEAELMKREAILGSQARSICHEINNAITIIRAQSELLGNSIRDITDPNSHRVDRIKRAVSQLMKLTSVVLDEIGTNKDVVRDYPVTELVLDFKALLVRHFRQDARARFEFYEPEEDLIFGKSLAERMGTTYLIAHNLVKNAFEACETRDHGDSNGIVRLTLDIKDNQLVMTVFDTGPGISETIRCSILARAQCSTKDAGYGLGMKFVVDEIRKNGMTLKISNNQPRGTSVEVRANLKAPKSEVMAVPQIV